MTAKDFLDISTFIVAAGAFAATFWQGYLAHKHNRLIVRPRLAWNRAYQSTDPGTEVTFSLENNGVGPAIVRDRFFTTGERPYTENGPITDDLTARYVRSVIPETVAYFLVSHGLPGPRHAILPGASMTIAKLFFPERNAGAVEALMRELGVGFSVRYESLYGETFWMKV
jgi:hypothetical protein